MAETLHFALPQDRLHPAFNSYSLDLHACAEAAAEGTPFELSIANSLWGQQGFAFLPEFLDLLGENDGAGMRLVDYASDPDATAPELFRLPDGSTLDVAMMHQDEAYGYALGEGYRALELPYENGNVSMLIIQPEIYWGGNLEGGMEANREYHERYWSGIRNL